MNERNCDEEMEANNALEHDLYEALDRCEEKRATDDDLRLIAWHCGVRWAPKNGRQSFLPGATTTNEQRGA